MKGIIQVTARDILNAGCWGEFCKLRDINPCSINEGFMSETELFTLSDEEAKQLYLVKEPTK